MLTCTTSLSIFSASHLYHLPAHQRICLQKMLTCTTSLSIFSASHLYHLPAHQRICLQKMLTCTTSLIIFSASHLYHQSAHQRICLPKNADSYHLSAYDCTMLSVLPFISQRGTAQIFSFNLEIEQSTSNLRGKVVQSWDTYFWSVSIIFVEFEIRPSFLFTN